MTDTFSRDLDRIALRGVRARGFHGVFDEERRVSQGTEGRQGQGVFHPVPPSTGRPPLGRVAWGTGSMDRSSSAEGTGIAQSRVASKAEGSSTPSLL